jgi:hypothetical protein
MCPDISYNISTWHKRNRPTLAEIVISSLCIVTFGRVSQSSWRRVIIFVPLLMTASYFFSHLERAKWKQFARLVQCWRSKTPYIFCNKVKIRMNIKITFLALYSSYAQKTFQYMKKGNLEGKSFYTNSTSFFK